MEALEARLVGAWRRREAEKAVTEESEKLAEKLVGEEEGGEA